MKVHIYACLTIHPSLSPIPMQLIYESSSARQRAHASTE